MANKLSGAKPPKAKKAKKKGGDNVVELKQPNGAAAAQASAAPDPKAKPAKPLGNITDETIQELNIDYAAKRDALEESVQEQRKLRADVSAVKKRAKKLGLDPEYLTRYYDMKAREPESVQKEVAEFNRILVAMRFPIGYQMGLFEDGETVATKIDNNAKANAPAPTTPETVQKAWREGHAAGEAGKGIGESNPYDLETKEWEAFEDGYSAQQATKARGMGPTSTPTPEADDDEGASDDAETDAEKTPETPPVDAGASVSEGATTH